jgi:hypothetical protein
VSLILTYPISPVRKARYYQKKRDKYATYIPIEGFLKVFAFLNAIRCWSNQVAVYADDSFLYTFAVHGLQHGT